MNITFNKTTSASSLSISSQTIYRVFAPAPHRGFAARYYWGVQLQIPTVDPQHIDKTPSLWDLTTTLWEIATFTCILHLGRWLAAKLSSTPDATLILSLEYVPSTFYLFFISG